jgi:hypothetical protein
MSHPTNACISQFQLSPNPSNSTTVSFHRTSLMFMFWEQHTKIPCLRIQKSVQLLNYDILSSFTHYFMRVSNANFKILIWYMPYAIWNTADGIEKIKCEYCLWTIWENLFLPVPIPLCSTWRWTVETWTVVLLSGDSGILICGNWLKLEPYLLKKYVASYDTDW